MLTKNSKKILIIKHGSLGDIVFSLHAMCSIRNHFINSELHLLTESSFVNFIQKSKYFNKILVDNRNGLLKTIKIIRYLLKENFDLVIDLQNSKRSNLYNFFLKYFGKAIINGNRNHSDYKYNIKPKGEESPKNGLINQIKLLGIKPIEDNFKWLLSDINIHKIENSVLVIPSASKSGMHKKWPVNKYIKLCKKIEELGYSICLVGSENDRATTSKIAKSCKNTIDLTSKSPPDVIYSAALKCKLIITNDTGPGHIAALSKNSIIWIAQKNITSKVNIENNKHNELILSEKIEQISVDNVFQKIKKILIKY